MKPITFKGQNVVFGADQPEYEPLPALKMPDGEVITCWQLSEAEIQDLIKNKCLFIRQFTFNKSFNSLFPCVNLEDGFSIA